MYEEYFGLKKEPFSIVPDPGYFYMSEGHCEALAHLVYGVKNNGGFVLLTGEVGTGKTTVCRRLLQTMRGETEVAFILNPRMTSEELLATICDEFGITYPEGTTSIKTLVTLINDYLLRLYEEGRKAVLILEEAQNLSADVLEQIRLLTNLETNRQKLVQMIMLGQPELREILSRPQLRQLSQRITARYHLGPLRKNEVAAYVNYRLEVAGTIGSRLFPPRTLKMLFRLTGGVPRLINAVCDRALLGAFVEGRESVTTKTLAFAAREVTGKERAGVQGRRVFAAITGSLFVVCLIGFLYYVHAWKNPPSVLPEPPPKTALNAERQTALSVQEMTLDLPAGISASETRDMAYAALFRQWQAQYEQHRKDFCQQAEDQGLRCLMGRGSIRDLIQMNRPAVLTLIDRENGEYFGNLTSLKEKAATVAVGTESRTVSHERLAQSWSGDFLLLWRAPREYTKDLHPGGHGPMVAWLQQALMHVQGLPPPATPATTYNGAIVKQVKTFQIADGMIPDGIVGPRTLIRLGHAAGLEGPVLDSRQEGH